MAQLVKKRRPGWVLLVVSALVASLFAVPAAAIDDDSKPNKPAATSACVEDATRDRMFSDVSQGHYFRGAINCLAYYGVTVGYGDGTFKPNDGVSREEMVLFMGRAAAAAGANAEAVVGDFATTGSDPVNRGHMALLIARLLVASTTDESAVNVKNNDDGTFAVTGVTGKDWDFFADARRSLNRVEDSAVSALYELGVAKGTGMGHFSPASTVNRGAMAAFITRALAHTSARPSGVTIQSDGPGEVLISIRDANFHPVANAPVDVFSAKASQAGEAFKADGSCNTARVRGQGGNTTVCEIDALDAITGLNGDYDPGAITGHAANVATGGTTVWAWTGANGAKVTNGGAGIRNITLTKVASVTADAVKVTTDITEHATRVHFGETVTVTLQLVGVAPARANAVADTGGNTYTVTIRRANDTNIQTDESPGEVTASASTTTETKVLEVDASGKATFTITAADPDATDKNNANGAPDADPVVPNQIDRTRVTFSVALTSGGRAVANDISSTTDGSQTITFSDARGVFTRGSLTTRNDYLSRPATGAAGNVAIVKTVDQYGKPFRGHLVRLSSTLAPSDDRTATYPVARRTDSSGTVRIGYTYTGGATTESLVANTSVTDSGGDETLTAITGATKTFYWVAPAPMSTTSAPNAASGVVVAADLDNNMLVVAHDGGPRLVIYDNNDQFTIGDAPVTQAAFEEALTTDGKRAAGRNDTIVVTSYDPSDAADVARFALSVVADG